MNKKLIGQIVFALSSVLSISAHAESCWEVTGWSGPALHNVSPILVPTDCAQGPLNSGWTKVDAPHQASPNLQFPQGGLWVAIHWNDSRVTGTKFYPLLGLSSYDANQTPIIKTYGTACIPCDNHTQLRNEPPCYSFSFRTASGHYLVAEGGGDSFLAADRTAIGPWEKFEITDLEHQRPAAILGGDHIRLRAFNRKYVVAEGSGGGVVNANREVASTWETFRIINLDGTTPITNGTHVGLQADNGMYVVAEGGGGFGGSGSVNANRTWLGPSETFVVTVNNSLP